MRLNLSSSAPHIHPAFDWNPDVGTDELVMYRNPEFRVEGGLRECKRGKRSFKFVEDELWLVMHGFAQFRRDSGEVIDAEPYVAVHFKEGWTGEAEIGEDMRMSYMRCLGEPGEITPVLRDVANVGPLADWGAVSTRIIGISEKYGIQMSRAVAPRRAETGIWSCTPGTWRCEVKSDEFCHFLAGNSLYTNDNGEQIEIVPDTLAFFPAGWKGICEVRETVRKVYMIR
ncbi:protein of unknown function DUF861, cupin_3 [Candidatus Koribacter versatilis Ellin345]|uniref:(S)-ureidoglycine aminohydrolase cupin domain-containing protein n=1 Tax=Koribacter versatilis (strain Ellin345) TaxID=204669 RepID=Q1IV05_KORVE|nr:protein of unknown function DUF861, cupin_3 [Candidatus Koribacter versatilis Ellin345]